LYGKKKFFSALNPIGYLQEKNSAASECRTASLQAWLPHVFLGIILRIQAYHPILELIGIKEKLEIML
jgi:hypothetical protein